MVRHVFTGSKGAKAVAGALLLLVLFAWLGSTVRTSGAEETAPAAPEDGTTPGPRERPEWDGFRSEGPDLPVERLVITLVVLVGGAGVALWVLKRVGGGRVAGLGLGGTPRMQLVGRLPLGGRRGLVLVRAAGRLLVLGVSEAGVQKVLERDDDEVDPDDFAGALERAEEER
jgi:hypothetical protein